jgi:hypothetical protein
VRNKFLIILIAFFVFFSLVGCDKEAVLEKGDDTNTNTNDTNEESETDLKLYSDDSKIVFNFNDLYYITYYHNGETITGLEYVYDYGSYETAKMYVDSYAINDSYKQENNVKSIKQNGQYLIITFNESEYEDQTLESIKQTYSYLEQVYNKD